MQSYDEYTPMSSLHDTTHQLLQRYPEIQGAQCIFIYFDREYVYHFNYRYGPVYDLTQPLLISYWSKGMVKPVTVYKQTHPAAQWTFRVKDDKSTHRIDASHQYHLLKIHLPAFKAPTGKLVFKHEITPVTNAAAMSFLEAIKAESADAFTTSMKQKGFSLFN